MFIFNRHTLKISNGGIMMQESSYIGVSQKDCFKEEDCVAKTPLGRNTLKISNGGIMMQESSYIGVSQKDCFKEEDCVAKTPLGRKDKQWRHYDARVFLHRGFAERLF